MDRELAQCIFNSELDKVDLPLSLVRVSLYHKSAKQFPV